jgi:ADP-ribose pyrophosphatase
MSQRGSREERASTLTSSRTDGPGSPLTAPPRIEVELVRELRRVDGGFLAVREVELRNRYDDGSASEPYRYSMVERANLDAVALVLYKQTERGTEILLRSQLRPPLAFRASYELPLLALGTGAVQWEIPAGLIESGERGEAGLFARASAEALEEAGLAITPARFALLGPATSLSPGLIAEKLHFVCAELRGDEVPRTATGDGHAVEERSLSLLIPLAEALAAVERGLVHDIKTELGARRLAARVGGSR